MTTDDENGEIDGNPSLRWRYIRYFRQPWKLNGNNACRRLILRIKITGLITRFRGYPSHSKYDDSNMKKTQHRTSAGFCRAPKIQACCYLPE
ncbi:hypothetical protein MJ390_08130 [Klebsiella pneumoniae]|nr:hypothetical protein MJ390_08130 [Klebsiella pneumoniae]